jgi:signal transduction histidine kinase
MTWWAHGAMSYAMNWKHTVLAFGRWRAGPIETRQRPKALIFVPTFTADGGAWGALAVVTASMDIDREVIRAAERCAWTITNVVSQAGEAPASVAIAMPWLLPARPAVNSGPRKDILSHEDFLLHELRVPLSAATYALAALAKRQGADWEGEGEVERLVYTAQLGVLEAQSIMRSASQLWSIDNELIELDIRAVSIGWMLEQVLTLLPTARSRVRLELHEDVPLIAADERRLKQALTNLLENAVKYSWSHTPITVAAHLTGRDRVLICIHSQGRGIPSEQQSLLDRHARDVRNTPPDDLTSKGLGLSIARDFITGMGGHLWIESDGTGAVRVELTLPIAHV